MVWPGVFVDAAAWHGLTPDARYILRIRAAVPRLEPRYVVSHASALAVHGVSSLRPWPRKVHVVDPSGDRGQSRGGLAKHPGPLAAADVCLVDGIRATGLARTCVDLALEAPFEVAVAAIDECLRREFVTGHDLAQRLAVRPHARGRVAARRALAFANAKSDSGGESWCRCRLFELGTPCPTQQEEFTDAFGLIGFVEFWFAEQSVVVEFDGDQKYLNPRYTRGRTPAEVALAERKRERRLLALPACARWFAWSGGTWWSRGGSVACS